MTIWRRVACWIIKAKRAQAHAAHVHLHTHTHTHARTHARTYTHRQKYVILIAFPQQLFVNAPEYYVTRTLPVLLNS